MVKSIKCFFLNRDVLLKARLEIVGKPIKGKIRNRGGNMEKKTENKMYGLYIAYVCSKKSYSLNFFENHIDNVFSYACINYIKPFDKLLWEDYEIIIQSIIEEINKGIDEEKQCKLTKSNITILNIIPKEYEKYDKEKE